MIVHNPNTRDPEIRFTARSTPVAELGFAVTRNTLTEGQRREEVLFVDVTLWSRLAEIAEQYLQKGSTVFVEGRLQLGRETERAETLSIACDRRKFTNTQPAGAKSAIRPLSY
jgi:single-strand DNA-binding protein